MSIQIPHLLDEFDRGPGCWLWTGRTCKAGYGMLRRSGSHGAHRAMYELHVGPIPPGWDVDHLCHNEDPTCTDGATCLHRRCVRPEHLRATTPSENRRNQYTARKTHCVNGHPRTPDNLYQMPSGGRDCRTCIRDRVRRYRNRLAKEAS